MSLDKQEVPRHLWVLYMVHCTAALENGADLYVNEQQKMRHYRAMSAEERRRRKKKKECQIAILFFTSCSAYVK